ncbi:hypothetical protein [Rhizobium leguminosarum]|uniref:hypothetical protein n=1 Tax=Rhizobium leguminosarum TaxID=384 RepID=UPI0004183EF3|nr:hypothetical protein [Rhizobium leguminosarum]
MEYEATRKKEAGHANEIEITDEVIEAGLDASGKIQSEILKTIDLPRAAERQEKHRKGHDIEPDSACARCRFQHISPFVRHLNH